MTIAQYDNGDGRLSIRDKLNRSLYRYVNTVADLIAITDPTDDDCVFLLGYAVVGDFDGLLVHYDLSSSLPDLGLLRTRSGTDTINRTILTRLNNDY